MPAILAQGLRKRFGTVQALDGLTLSVDDGAVFGFLGPNGAGETTAIRILTGLARADQGRATVAGQTVGVASSALARRLGYLPEEPAFYTWMTPTEFLEHVGAIFGLSLSVRRARSRELLEQVGLVAAARRRIGGFSRGMRQRLGIAQALVNQPDVLFLDEPVSALDPAGRKEVLSLIAALRGRCTVFMSTHILADVERICDTVGIIARGRLIAEARQDELLSRYAVPGFEMEAENGSDERVRTWAASLLGLGWVTSAVADGPALRIVVRDVEQAKRQLLPLALEAGLVLRRYEMVQPSLEDVFLRLTAGGGLDE